MSDVLISYSVKQVAKILGRSPYWVRQQAHEGLIGHTRVGSSYRFFPDHLNEYLRAREIKPPRPARAAAGGRAQPREAAGADTPVLQARTARPQRRRAAQTA